MVDQAQADYNDLRNKMIEALPKEVEKAPEDDMVVQAIRNAHNEGARRRQNIVDSELVASLMAMNELAEGDRRTPRNQPSFIGAPTMRALMRVLARHGYTSDNVYTHDPV